MVANLFPKRLFIALDIRENTLFCFDFIIKQLKFNNLNVNRMKKQILIIAILLFGSFSLFSQASKGDVEVMQKLFGVEKAAVIKEYMALTPQQDSVFWPIYNKYENERLALGTRRIELVDEYLKNVQNVSTDKAKEMVSNGVDLEIKFKKLQKKYFTELSKKIGPVKAGQFYQFENYINNLINLSIQQSIPFVGELQQKYSIMPKKK